MGILAAFALPHPPLIIPEVGRGSEKRVQKTIDSCAEVGRRIAKLRPETVVISSPHSVMYSDYIHISPGRHASGSFANYGAPEARYEAHYDMKLVQRICDLADDAYLAAGTEGERDPSLDHGTMIAIHAIEDLGGYHSFQVVRMGISGLSPAEHYRLGMIVAQAAEELHRRVVYVASGDLSHKLQPDGPYGFAEEGPIFDEKVCDAFSTGNFLELLTMDPSLCERAAECGLRSFQIMAGALDRTPVKAELLSHEDVTGVGYGVACFTPTGKPGSAPERNFLDQYEQWHKRDMAQRRNEEDPYVRLARTALETWVTDNRRINPGSDLPEELLTTRAGCFVSIKKNGQLRGCIGTIQPTRANLASEICSNAISAGTRDPRFLMVVPSDLPELVYDVDVLSTPEPISSIAELDPKRYGVIVSCADGRRGLLLPDLDGVDTVDEQVSIAARKGGIDLRSDDYTLERFEVVRHT
ncbi:MAG: AmmeMemoRadiSam system protein A [Tractidigestivibacter sp.]|jgi:AmmeMemoRadiSam system protein A|uniref:AmmeMemoRadiSam system protein A n=1 Tax=Tractidigestivibacter sp. TaxID=2847320 RepID=UPI003D8C314F